MCSVKPLTDAIGITQTTPDIGVSEKARKAAEDEAKRKERLAAAGRRGARSTLGPAGFKGVADTVLGPASNQLA